MFLLIFNQEYSSLNDNHVLIISFPKRGYFSGKLIPKGHFTFIFGQNDEKRIEIVLSKQ